MPESATVPLERAIARLAGSQHGVVTASQLEALGLSARATRQRAAAGRLHRVHRGVYAVGHPLLAAHGRRMAAVLACGADAVLSHRSAAALHALRASARTGVDVTTPSRAGRSRTGITAHSAGTLAAADRTTVSGVPCTTVARTLVDLGDVLPRRALERAFDQGEMAGAFDLVALRAALSRSGRRRGHGLVTAILAEHAIGDTLTRSELEERFLALCRDARLPQPLVNSHVAPDDGNPPLEVDFCWPGQRLVVETDGLAFHGTPAARERDADRELRLELAGWEMKRFTWHQVTRTPTRVLAVLAAHLG